MTIQKLIGWFGIVLAPSAGVFAVSIDVVTVGNPGNAPDTRYTTPGRGAVGYTYQIGKFEITTAQYVEFLNAVARTDTHGLYSEQMDPELDMVVPGSGPLWHGCGIKQHGVPGDYSYSVAPDLTNRPVNVIPWHAAIQFANWMHNGQLGDYASTLDGSYRLDPVSGWLRQPNATWVLPTEDEWYKAAYHKNDGVTANYWEYATAGDTINSSMATLGRDSTDVGTYVNYSSPYGTFDQTGNVAEWTETGFELDGFGVRVVRHLGAQYRWELDTGWPGTPDTPTGFRLAYVPEPATLSLLAVALTLLTRRRAGMETRDRG